MGQIMTVKLRGQDLEIEITHDGGYEPDTNAHEVEYEPRSITVEEYNAMGVTAEEEMSIYDQIYPQLDKDTFGV